MDQDAVRRGVAEFIGAFALIVVGSGSMPLAPVPPGPPETGLDEPRPDAAAAA